MRLNNRRKKNSALTVDPILRVTDINRMETKDDQKIEVITFDFISRLEFIPAGRIAAHALIQPISFTKTITCAPHSQPFHFSSMSATDDYD